MNRKSHPLLNIFVCRTDEFGNADSDSCFQLRPIVLKSASQGLCLR